MTTGRSVIITGAARGIGFGIGTCFAERGDRIAVADLNLQAAQEAAELLMEQGAPEAIGIECDVSKRDSVEAMVAAVVEAFGEINVLVNNAGICPFVDVMEMTPDIWQKVIDVNLTGAFHCTQLVARRMIDQGTGGRVVCITSLSEHVTGPKQVDYAASKSGLRMMTVGFATALGPHGITCNNVAPGMILTDMTRHHWEKPGPAEEIKKRVPMGRIGNPIDIGRVVVFLASDEAEYVNGITVRVDGGHQAKCV